MYGYLNSMQGLAVVRQATCCLPFLDVSSLDLGRLSAAPFFGDIGAESRIPQRSPGQILDVSSLDLGRPCRRPLFWCRWRRKPDCAEISGLDF